MNVWMPAVSVSERLPVLVWIQAGAGTMGSTARPMYDGNALAKEDVVDLIDAVQEELWPAR